MSQIANALGWTFRFYALSSSAPEDLGLPVTNAEATAIHKIPDSNILDLSIQRIGNRPGLLIFDELSQASPALQNSAMRVINESRAGDTTLGPNVRRAGIMNPTDSASGTYDLTSTMSNRLCHLPWVLPHRDWVDGMRRGFPPPPIYPLTEDWQNGIPQWRNLIATFIDTLPDRRHRLPADDNERGGPWPSSRSWHMGARLCAAAESYGPDVQMQLLSGCVGDAPSGEFFSWLVNLDLPDPAEVLKDPAIIKRPAPHEEYKIYAIMGGVMALFRANPKPAVWNQLWSVIVHVHSFSPDVALPFAYDINQIRISTPGLATASIPSTARQVLRRLGEESGLISGGAS
jgi:hypothetical protein